MDFAPGRAFRRRAGDRHLSPVHDCASPVGYSVTDSRGREAGGGHGPGRGHRRGAGRVRGRGCWWPRPTRPGALRWGSLSLFLKARILGDRGHLSNEMGGRAGALRGGAGAADHSGPPLSGEQHPQMAYAAVERTLIARACGWGPTPPPGGQPQ